MVIVVWVFTDGAVYETEQLPDEREHWALPPRLELKPTIPVGVICAPGAVSLTVTVHVEL
jgi:hypothetical protein